MARRSQQRIVTGNKNGCRSQRPAAAVIANASAHAPSRDHPWDHSANACAEKLNYSGALPGSSPALIRSPKVLPCLPVSPSIFLIAALTLSRSITFLAPRASFMASP